MWTIYVVIVFAKDGNSCSKDVMLVYVALVFALINGIIVLISSATVTILSILQFVLLVTKKKTLSEAGESLEFINSCIGHHESKDDKTMREKI